MEIEYSIIRSKRKTISIIIERDRKVVVRAPLHTTDQHIFGEIVKRKRLIREKIDHNQKYPYQKSLKEFVSGESLMFLGKQYKLLLSDEEIEEVQFDNKFIISKTNKKSANRIFRNWYKKTASEILIPKVKSYAKQLGVSFNTIKILDIKYRWGSCTPKSNINFNWRIIKAPITVIDYIIVHELTHLIEANHTDKFWDNISIILPQYKKAKDWLKDYGYLLETDF